MTTSTLTREDLVAAKRARKVAELRYQKMIIKAREEGWNNSEIARAVGVSEAAIRLYWLRHPELVVLTRSIPDKSRSA
jgi:DNA-directed RNA polymerase specialized sigma24 family protein